MKLVFGVTVCAVAILSCTPRQAVTVDANNNYAAAVSFSEGNGASINDAVMVHGATSPAEGIAAEHKYISTLHGQRGQGWFLVGQTLVQDQNRSVDVVEIQLNDPGNRKVIFFDASGYMPKE